MTEEINPNEWVQVGDRLYYYKDVQHVLDIRQSKWIERPEVQE